MVGAVIVTTPQDVSLLDAGKALAMFKKLGIVVLGIIENMTIYVCSYCGQEEAIFGSGGGELMATENHIPLLGKIPLNSMIRKNADAGIPITFSDPTSALANSYREIAFALIEQLLLQPINYAVKFQNTVIEGEK